MNTLTILSFLASISILYAKSIEGGNSKTDDKNSIRIPEDVIGVSYNVDSPSNEGNPLYIESIDEDSQVRPETLSFINPTILVSSTNGSSNQKEPIKYQNSSSNGIPIIISPYVPPTTTEGSTTVGPTTDSSLVESNPSTMDTTTVSTRYIDIALLASQRLARTTPPSPLQELILENTAQYFKKPEQASESQLKLSDTAVISQKSAEPSGTTTENSITPSQKPKTPTTTVSTTTVQSSTTTSQPSTTHSKTSKTTSQASTTTLKHPTTTPRTSKAATPSSKSTSDKSEDENLSDVKKFHMSACKNILKDKEVLAADLAVLDMEMKFLGKVSVLGLDHVTSVDDVDIKIYPEGKYVSCFFEIGPIKIVPSSDLEHRGIVRMTLPVKVEYKFSKAVSGNSLTLYDTKFNFPRRSEIQIRTSGSEDRIYLQLARKIWSPPLSSSVVDYFKEIAEPEEAVEMFTSNSNTDD